MNTTNSKQKLNYIPQIIIGIGIIAIAVVVWWHIPDSFWKYLFCLRAPILWGLLLVTLPLIATLWLPAMLRNLFVLRGPWQLISVILSANMAAIGVIINAYMLLKGAPDRFGLSPWLEISDIWQYGLAIALSLPICFTSYKLSKEEIKEKNPIQGVIFSVLLSLVLLFAVIQTKTWIFTNFANNKLLISFVEFITRHKTEGYIIGTQPKPQQFLEGHLSNIAFFYSCLHRLWHHWLEISATISTIRSEKRSGCPNVCDANHHDDSTLVWKPNLLFRLLSRSCLSALCGYCCFDVCAV